MIKKEVINLNNTLNGINAVKGNIQLSYAIVKNISILKSDVEALQEVSKEYTEKRDVIIKNRFKKDSKGKEILEDGKPVVDTERFEKSIKEFDEANKKFVEAYNKILEEEVKLELYKVPITAFEGLYVVNTENNQHVDISLSAFELMQFELIIKS